MNEPRFSRTELKVQSIARRRAIDQLLRVPWTKFRRAYEEYPRWHALALWVQGVVATQDSVPSSLVANLRKHCPDFIEREVSSHEPKLIPLHLLEWIHNREFGYAKRQGWLDALIFFGVRHPRSECAWAYWEHCEDHWSREQSDEFPLFDEWWHKALQMKHDDEISYSDVAKAVETYIDWKALLLWLRPLFASSAKLPKHVRSELERRCPGILGGQNSDTRRGIQEKSKIWQRLIRWGKGHFLLEPKQAGWLDSILRGLRFHPRHVRLVAYGKYWPKERLRNPARPYPSFREWRQAADSYIEAGPMLFRQPPTEVSGS
jgi:hypothetical protein